MTKRLMKWGINRKLALGLAVVFVLWLSLMWAAYYQISVVESGFTALLKAEEPAKAASYKMEVSVMSAGFSVLGYLDSRDPKQLESFEKSARDFDQHLKNYLGLAGAKSNHFVTGNLRTRYANFKALANELVALENKRIAAEQEFEQHIGAIDRFLHDQAMGTRSEAVRSALLETDNALHYFSRRVERVRWSAGVNGPVSEDPNLRDARSRLNHYVQKSLGGQSLGTRQTAHLTSAEDLASQLHVLGDKVWQLRSDFVRLRDELSHILKDGIQAATGQNLEAAKSGAREDAQVSRYSLLAILLAALGGAIAASLIAARSIAVPISRLLRGMDKIGNGDLNHQIVLRSNDEMAELGASLNAMVARLRESLVSRDYISSILMSLNEALFVLGDDGRVRTVNDAACRLSGFAENDLIGMPLTTLFPSMASGKAYDALANPVRREIHLRRVNNQTVLVSVSLNRLRDSTGATLGIVCVAEDINLRKQNETRLLDLSRRLGQTAKRLAKELKEREWLQRRVLDISEEENKRVGQELHDGLGQEMAGIAYLCMALENKLKQSGASEAGGQASRIVQLLRESMGKMRALARGLHPRELDELGLAPALASLCKDIQQIYDVDCQFNSQKLPEVPKAAANHVYRIAQESLCNAIKHGQANDILIHASVRRGKLRVTITDNGLGFDKKAIEGQSGLGLRGMRFRAESIGAKISVRTRLGAGCSVFLFLPLHLEQRVPLGGKLQLVANGPAQPSVRKGQVYAH
jgi:PAS domain S-box-containing protein